MEHQTEFTKRLAEEVRVEAARQNITTQTELGKRSGLGQVNVQRYFYAVDRPVPISAVVAVAKVFGLPASELMARAEAGAPDLPKRPVVRRVTGRAVSRRRRDG